MLIGIQALVYAGSAARFVVDTRLVSRASGLWLHSAAAVSLAIGMAAFVLLPLIDAQNNSASFHTYYTGIGAMAYSLDLLPTLLSPGCSMTSGRRFPTSRHSFRSHSGIRRTFSMSE